MVSRARAGASCVALALVLLLGAHSTLLAHATLVSSSPAAEARLRASPERVSLVFSEPLEVSLAELTLVLPDGIRRRLEAGGDPHDVHAIVAAVDGVLPLGSYRLLYRVVSADGHPVQGSVAFSVGTSDTRSLDTARSAQIPTDTESAGWGPEAAGAPIIPALLRGLGLGALMALTGLLWFATTSTTRAPTAERIALWLAVAAPLLLASHLFAWVANVTPEHHVAAESLSAALASRVGQVEIVRTALAALALWALALVRRPRLALVFCLLAVVASGATGHASALHPLLATPAKAAHLLAIAAWLGGLIWLMSCLGHSETDAREASRVSTMALGAAIIVTLTGVVQTVLFVASPAAFMHSFYGAVVLAKVAGLLVLIGYGAFHRYRVLPNLARQLDARLARTLRQEIAVMIVVVLLGGFLAYLSPEPTTSVATAPPSRVID